jgi:transposase-like protein
VADSRCSACARDDVDQLEAALAAGVPVRAVARRYGLGRGVLARHRQHMDASASRPLVHGRDHFDAAVQLLERANSERERLRGLEAVRAAVGLELRDHSRARAAIRTPDKDQLALLERNVEDAWTAYERVASGGLDLQLRALAGVREALASDRDHICGLSATQLRKNKSRLDRCQQ